VVEHGGWLAGAQLQVDGNRVALGCPDFVSAGFEAAFAGAVDELAESAAVDAAHLG
jgi:hypothetical protein